MSKIKSLVIVFAILYMSLGTPSLVSAQTATSTPTSTTTPTATKTPTPSVTTTLPDAGWETPTYIILLAGFSLIFVSGFTFAKTYNKS